MIYHVLAGDSLTQEFRKTGIEGSEIVCRECLIVGDVDAASLPEFWDQRARFILSEYAEDEIVYHETVADELGRLLDLDDGDEVTLWFEYELFCSVNLWFCLWLLNETDAAVYRVEPVVRSEKTRWLGFGRLDAADLKTCFNARVSLSRDDVRLGAELWNAYRVGDTAKLAEIATTISLAFPYLAEIVQAAIDKDTRPADIVAEMNIHRKTDVTEIFPEFTRRAGVYGLGDLQVQRLLDKSVDSDD